MSTDYLISVPRLADLCGAPQVRIVDCRFVLSAPEKGRRAYAAGHIPGAIYAHLDDDLAGPVTPASGRHPLPAPERFAARLGRWGIGPTTLVVAYDDAEGAVAARLWWMLGWMGHERRALLDGGLAAWSTEGHPLEQSMPGPEAQPPYPFRLRPGRVVGTEELAAGLDDFLVIDARGRERFLGLREPIDPVAGHVPGAINHPFNENVDESGRFLPADELARRYRRLLSESRRRPVTMCGSGVTACHNSFAMALAGLAEPQLYAGSWSEWIRDPSRPIATGRD